MSRVPQGSVLGPILFLIYINDLDDDITSKVLMFADDTKVFRKIKSDADRQPLQDDINKLTEWSSRRLPKESKALEVKPFTFREDKAVL